MNISNYKYKVELHAHTSPVSSCSDLSAERIIELLSEHNTSAVVITNHFWPGFFENGDKDELIKKYIKDLLCERNHNKESRVRLNKIQDYIKVLQEKGTFAGEPYVKYMEAEKRF